MNYIGTAGWYIPKEFSEFFQHNGTHLEKNSKVFNITEINQTFYKLPKDSTFSKWAKITPNNFKFSVKLHRKFTHFKRLGDVEGLKDFLTSISNLQNKLFSILVQLPPSLEFEKDNFEKFFSYFRKIYKGYIALEARNRSWIDSDELLKKYKIARVATDPSRFDLDKEPGGYKEISYFRLHGSPKIYYSEYSQTFLNELAAKIKKLKSKNNVIIFDNTAGKVAIKNALELKEILNETK